MDDANEHDHQAVAVFIGHTKVGYLNREMAPLFRQALARNQINRPTSCDAVIFGGGSYADKEFDYSVQLDFNLEDEFSESTGTRPTYPVPDPVSPNPVVLSQTETECFLKVHFLDEFTLDLCRMGRYVKEWRRPDGSELIFYAPGSVGGTGKVAALKTSDYPALMRAWEAYRYVSVYRVEGRSLVLRAGVEFDPRYGFRERGSASVVLLHLDRNEARPSQIAVMTFLVDLGAGNGALAKDFEPYCTLLPLNATGIESLKKIVGGADALASYDADWHKKALKSFLGELVLEKPWGCARSALEFGTGADADVSIEAMCERAKISRSEEASLLSECRAISELLFIHTGKTKRSRTYMSYLLLKLT